MTPCGYPGCKMPAEVTPVVRMPFDDAKVCNFRLNIVLCKPHADLVYKRQRAVAVKAVVDYVSSTASPFHGRPLLHRFIFEYEELTDAEKHREGEVSH